MRRLTIMGDFQVAEGIAILEDALDNYEARRGFGEGLEDLDPGDVARTLLSYRAEAMKRQCGRDADSAQELHRLRTEWGDKQDEKKVHLDRFGSTSEQFLATCREAGELRMAGLKQTETMVKAFCETARQRYALELLGEVEQSELVTCVQTVFQNGASLRGTASVYRSIMGGGIVVEVAKAEENGGKGHFHAYLVPPRTLADLEIERSQT